MADLSEDDLKTILGPNYNAEINKEPGFAKRVLGRLTGRRRKNAGHDA